MLMNANDLGFPMTRGQVNANLLKNLATVVDELDQYPEFRNAIMPPGVNISLKQLIEQKTSQRNFDDPEARKELIAQLQQRFV